MAMEYGPLVDVIAHLCAEYAEGHEPKFSGEPFHISEFVFKLNIQLVVPSQNMTCDLSSFLTDFSARDVTQVLVSHNWVDGPSFGLVTVA